MAFTLELTDGTDTIDFIQNAFKVEDGGLQISAPEKLQTWTDPTTAGLGSRLVDNRYGNRTINIAFHIAGETRADVRSGINRVNAILTKAIEHSLGKGSTRVTLRYGWDGVSTIDNFEVLAGELHLPDDVLSVEKLHATWGDEYRLTGCNLELTVSPFAYGESPSTGNLIELPLTNRNATSRLGGLEIKPFTDLRSITVGGLYVDNYVEIDGDDIEGDAPAKLRIDVMTTTVSPNIQRIMIGAQEKHNAEMVFHWADEEVELYLSGTTVAASYTVGGSVWRSGNIPANWSGRVWRVRLQDPEMYRAQRYRVFMSTGYSPYTYVSGVPMRVSVESSNGTTLAEGPIVEQYSSRGLAMIQDLGVVQIPPFSPKISDPQELYLSLNYVGGSQYDHAFTLGHIWLIPVDRGYRLIRMHATLGEYLADEPMVVDDDWDEVTFVSDAIGSTALPVAQGLYTPITLEPGKTSRIYFSFAGLPYIPSNQDTYRVRVYYSPVYTGAV